MKFFKQRWVIILIVIFLIGSGILLLVFTHQIVSVNPQIIGSDPGNKRLNELSNDAIFSSLPPGAQLIGSITQTPARYRHPAFEPPGWDGPSVTVNFVGAQTPTTIYQFYTKQASLYGWHSGSKGSLGLTDTWNKIFPDGANAMLSLFATKNGEYKLVGSISTY